jgi:hypothetical protein
MRIILLLTFFVSVTALSQAADPKPVVVKFGKLSAEVPTDWKSEKPNNRLRSHQFKLLSPIKDTPDAEVSVMPESDPNPEKYFPRWKAMFVPPEGKTVEDLSKVKKETVGTVVLHTLDVTGDWKYKERPFDPKSKEELRSNYRVIWAIVVTGDEASHVRLNGPMAVVEKHQPAFEKWLKSIK